jgi:hypothetical protein
MVTVLVALSIFVLGMFAANGAAEPLEIGDPFNASTLIELCESEHGLYSVTAASNGFIAVAGTGLDGIKVVPSSIGM